MEELFMAGNDGELSFVESNGNIVIEQGCQSFAPAIEQTQQNVYTPISQGGEQVYIIQSTAPQTVTSAPHQIQTFNQIAYAGDNILQPAQVIQQGQPDQQSGFQRVDNYPVVHKVVQPQQRILHVMPQQSQLVPNVVHLPIQQDSTQPHQNQINANPHPQYAYIQKMQNVGDTCVAANIQGMQQAVNVGNIQHGTPGQQITVAFQPTAASPNTRVQGPLRNQRPMNMVARQPSPHLRTYKARTPGSMAQNRPRQVVGINRARQEDFIQPVDRNSTVGVAGKVRASNPRQRKIVHQIVSSSNSVYSEAMTPENPQQIQAPKQPTRVVINEAHSSGDNGSSTLCQKWKEVNIVDESRVVDESLPKKLGYQTYAVKHPSRSSESEGAGGGTGPLRNQVNAQVGKNMERITLSNSPSKLILINDGKGRGKMYIVPQNNRFAQQHHPNASASTCASTGASAINSNPGLKGQTADSKLPHQLIVIQDPTHGKPRNAVEGPNVTNMVTHGNSVVMAQDISIEASKVPQGAKMNRTAASNRVMQSVAKNNINENQKESLTLCLNCGIMTEALIFCSSCKHPIAKNNKSNLGKNNLVSSSSSLLVSSTNNTQQITKELPNNCPNSAAAATTTAAGVATTTVFDFNVSRETSSQAKQEFYTKFVNNTRIVQSEKKPPTTRGRGRGRGRARGKSYDEPVILTLSSDDEEDTNSNSSSTKPNSQLSTVPGTPHSSGRVFHPAPMDASGLWSQHPAIRKEPVITQDMGPERNPDDVAVLMGANSNHSLSTHVSLKCRSIRIGSFKVAPSEPIEIKQRECIKFTVPPVGEDVSDPVSVSIPFRNLVSILAHFGNSLPVIFIYLRPAAAVAIRRALKMTDKSGFYFDPGSTEESHRRITFLPEKIEDDSKRLLKDLLNVQLVSQTESSRLFKELNQNEANEILIRSSPMELQPLLKMSGIRMNCEAKTLLIFPPPPSKGGITVTTDDYQCLEEEQFLNDVILDFYLKWLLLSKVSPEDRDRTHVFSTFFYKRLTSKPKRGRRPPTSEDDPRLTPAQKRHSRVKSWTKNVDLFAKDFILIPINEHSHWFLAVICFPGLDSPVRMSDGQPMPRTIRSRGRPGQCKPKDKKIEIPVVDDVEWSDRDEAEGDEDELDEDDAQEETAPSSGPTVDTTGAASGPENSEVESGESTAKKTSETGKVCQPPPPKKIKLDGEDGGGLPTTVSTTLSTGSTTIVTTGSVTITDKEQQPKSTKLDKDTKIKQPCIIIFDSLTGASRSRIVATLRDYLTVEYMQRKGSLKPFNRDSMPGACPKVPQQMNFSDCGVFTLQFAQNLFERPLSNFRLPIRTLTNWFDQEEVGRKRESIAALIASIMRDQKPNENISLPILHFNSSVETTLLKPPIVEKTLLKPPIESDSVGTAAGKGHGMEAMEVDRTNEQHLCDDTVGKGTPDTANPERIMDATSSTSIKKININLLNKGMVGAASIPSSVIDNDTKALYKNFCKLSCPTSSSSSSSTFQVQDTIMLLPSASSVIEASSISKDGMKSILEGNTGTVITCSSSQGNPVTLLPKNIASSSEDTFQSSVNSYHSVPTSQGDKTDRTRVGSIEIRDEDTSEVLLIFNPPDSVVKESSKSAETTDTSAPTKFSAASSQSPPLSTSSTSPVNKFTSSVDSAFQAVPQRCKEAFPYPSKGRESNTEPPVVSSTPKSTSPYFKSLSSDTSQREMILSAPNQKNITHEHLKRPSPQMNYTNSPGQSRSSAKSPQYHDQSSYDHSNPNKKLQQLLLEGKKRSNFHPHSSAQCGGKTVMIEHSSGEMKQAYNAQIQSAQQKQSDHQQNYVKSQYKDVLPEQHKINRTQLQEMKQKHFQQHQQKHLTAVKQNVLPELSATLQSQIVSKQHIPSGQRSHQSPQKYQPKHYMTPQQKFPNQPMKTPNRVQRPPNSSTSATVQNQLSPNRDRFTGSEPKTYSNQLTNKSDLEHSMPQEVKSPQENLHHAKTQDRLTPSFEKKNGSEQTMDDRTTTCSLVPGRKSSSDLSSDVSSDSVFASYSSLAHNDSTMNSRDISSEDSSLLSSSAASDSQISVTNTLSTTQPQPVNIPPNTQANSKIVSTNMPSSSSSTNIIKAALPSNTQPNFPSNPDSTSTVIVSQSSQPSPNQSSVPPHHPPPSQSSLPPAPTQYSLPSTSPPSQSSQVATSHQSLDYVNYNPPVASRTTSRGRIVNTPKKYRDSEDDVFCWKKDRHNIRGGKHKH